MKPTTRLLAVAALAMALPASALGNNKDTREDARYFSIIGSKLAACRMMTSMKRVRKAGVTVEVCMAEEKPAPQPPAPKAAAPKPAPVINNYYTVIPQPAPPRQSAVIEPPMPPANPKRRLIGICTFGASLVCQRPGKPDEVQPIRPITMGRPAHVTTICKSMLNEAAAELRADPRLRLFVFGNSNSDESALVAMARANHVREYLTHDKGIASSRIFVTLGKGHDRTVELWVGAK